MIATTSHTSAPQCLRVTAQYPDFTFENFTVCSSVDCFGVILANITLKESDEASLPQLRELVEGEQPLLLNVTIMSEAEGGSIEGMDLWDLRVFLSNTSDCSVRTTDTVNAEINDMQSEDIVAGSTVTFMNVQVSSF